MNLRKVLSPAVMFPELAGETKEAVIRDMVQRLAAVHKLESQLDEMIRVVLEREQKDSTGLEHGLAVPHGKTDAVPGLVAGIGRCTGGIDFATRDGAPAYLFIMTVSPKATSGPHLQFLSEVVRLLKDDRQREDLLAAPTADAMYRVMVR